MPCLAKETAIVMPQVMQDKLNKRYTASIENKKYTFQLEGHQLFCIFEEEADDDRRVPLMKNVLDAVCYDLDQEGNDELIVLTMSQDRAPYGSHSAYGEAIKIYDLTLEKGLPQLHLRYTNSMESVHPWQIAAGKLDDRDQYGQLFVGVYKNTRFYKETINRPFFLTWQGAFLKRKWTGSYLSTREYRDLIFVDFDGDGYDEVAALERQEDGTYIVSLYQWLTFGFEYLMSSKESFDGAEMIACEKPAQAGEHPVIWVKDKTGCEAVKF